MSSQPTQQDRILDGAPCVNAVVYGRGHEIEFGNAGFVRFFGSDGAGVMAHARPRLADRRLRACVDEVLASGRSRVIRGVPVRSLRPGRRSRRVRYFDLVVKPSAADASAPRSAFVFGVDVSGRVRAEHRLRHQTQRYMKLLEATATQIWLADSTGSRVQEVASGEPLPPLDRNPPTAETDQGCEYAAGRETLTCPPPVHAWRESVRHGTTFAVTRPVATPEGEHWMVTRAVPVGQGNGGVRQWLGLDIDVTDHVQAVLAMGASAERRISDVGGQLARVIESQQRLMRGFGHDIGNMLNAADGYAQLLEKKLYGRLTSEQHESIERIRGLLTSAGALVADVIRVARTESGLIELKRAPTELVGVVVEAVEGHRAEAVLKKLSFALERTEDEFHTYTDAARVRQILDNLLSNAVKFTDAGGVSVRIRSQVGREAGDRRRWFAISVADTGVGIPEANQERIFEEFMRLRQSDQEGAGIGLSISRRIAELLGGAITLESAPEQGSVFTLWLPVDRPPATSRTTTP